MQRAAFLTALGAALLTPAAASAAAGARSRFDKLSVAGDARDVPLVDQRGRTFTLRGLHAPAAVIFVATRCGDVCPISEGMFVRVAERLAAQKSSAQLLAITVEPQYDTPFVMASAAQRFGVSADRWRWASGTSQNIQHVMTAFGVGDIMSDTHGEFVYLLDRHGRRQRSVLMSSNAERDVLAALGVTTRG